jgi:hypothetical protein
MARISRLSAKLMVLIAISLEAHAQDKSKPLPSVDQRAERSNCTNIVALTGNVNINCSYLTPDQKKAISNIPSILKMALENKNYLEAILQKFDEMSKITPTVVNYAPGGFATSGGYIDHPTINTFRPPLPPIDVSEPIYGKAQPIYSQPMVRPGQMPAPPQQVGMSHPTASVKITLNGIFQNPQFVADCNVPCALTMQSFLGPGTSSSSDSRDFSPIATGDHMSAGAAINRQMFIGEKIQLDFESLDDRPLEIKNVRPYQP